eukprot:8968474-Pyramimonas_sp.AAC.1
MRRTGEGNGRGERMRGTTTAQCAVSWASRSHLKHPCVRGPYMARTMTTTTTTTATTVQTMGQRPPT